MCQMRDFTIFSLELFLLYAIIFETNKISSGETGCC